MLEPRTVDLHAVRRIESAAADALAPAVEIAVDGWRFRTDPSGTRRGNSVFPEHVGAGPLRARIRTVEAMYEARGAIPRFQLTSASQPSGAWRVLAMLGWTIVPGAFVLVRTCARSRSDEEAVVHAVDHDATTVVWDVVPDPRRAIERWFGSVHHRGAGVVSTGTFVVDRDRRAVGLFSLRTEDSWRGRGFGTQLVVAGLDRAHAEGIDDAYLQVDARNVDARRLYERLQFVEHHAYVYAERTTSSDRGPTSTPRVL